MTWNLATDVSDETWLGDSTVATLAVDIVAARADGADVDHGDLDRQSPLDLEVGGELRLATIAAQFGGEADADILRQILGLVLELLAGQGGRGSAVVVVSVRTTARSSVRS